MSVTPALSTAARDAEPSTGSIGLYDNESADYRFTDASGELLGWVNATIDGTRECRDGVDRTFECLNVLDTTRRAGTTPDSETELFGVSLAHAEAITIGTWPLGDVETRDVQLFAGVHREFRAFPLPENPPASANLAEAHRTFALAGLALPLRVGASDGGTYNFSGHPGQVDTREGPNRTVVASATFDELHTETSYRYTAVLNPQPEILWETAEVPSHMDTWREARYTVHCEGFGGPFVDINAATGGLIARVNRFGSGCSF